MSGEENQKSFSNKMEAVEGGEESAHIEELTSQNQLLDTMKKNEALEIINKELAEENQNLRYSKSKLESINKGLVDQIKSLKKRLNGSGVPNGVSHGVAKDVVREFNSSNLAKTRPPESQFNELKPKDLSNFMENYYEMEKQLDSLKGKQNQVEELKSINATLLAEKLKLEAENKQNEKELSSYIYDYIDIFNKYENFKENKVRAIDDDNGHDNEEDGENQEEPRELVGFFDPFNCEVRCSSCVFLFILHRMRLQLCTRRFLMYLQCTLCKKTGAKCEIGNCSYSLNDFYEAGLIEEVFNTPVTDTCTINDALCKARKELKGQSHPAVLSMQYEKNTDGTQPVGHSVAMMPDGKYIDARERRYWKPTLDNRITAIHVLNVRKSNIAELQYYCGLQKCSTECLIDFPSDEGTPSEHDFQHDLRLALE